jgi:hypothetical protein
MVVEDYGRGRLIAAEKVRGFDEQGINLALPCKWNGLIDGDKYYVFAWDQRENAVVAQVGCPAAFHDCPDHHQVPIDLPRLNQRKTFLTYEEQCAMRTMPHLIAAEF